MRARLKILPGTGRWKAEGLTEGAPRPHRHQHGAPSTTPLRVAVPHPVPGRICS